VAVPDKQAVTGREPNGRFKLGCSGNLKGRPASIPVELKAQLSDAAPAVIERIIDAALNGDMTAAKLVVERIAPPHKASAAPVHIPSLSLPSSMSDKASAILSAIGNGECPPDTGATLIQALIDSMRLSEIDDIEQRLQALEAKKSEAGNS